MTNGRIERKRAHDREAQRASRAKTKAYIAHLEKTVHNLTQRTEGDDSSNYIAQHASKQAQEIDSLQSLVSKIRTLVQDVGKPDSSETASPPSLKQEASIITEGSVNGGEELPVLGPMLPGFIWEDESSPSESHGDVHRPIEVTEQPRPQQRSDPDLVRSTPPMSINSHSTVMGVNLHCEANDDGCYLSRVNAAVALVEKSSRVESISTAAVDQDILIRAVFQGWNAAAQVHILDTPWQFFRVFDEGLWYSAAASPLERLANIWQMRNVMLYKIHPPNQPRREIPEFMYPTETQLSTPDHPPIVDYFVWPSIRDHLTSNGFRSTANSSIAFTSSFRFDWPFEIRDSYHHNRQTDLYSFSEKFLQFFNELESFRLVKHDLVPSWCYRESAAPDSGEGMALSTKSSAFTNAEGAMQEVSAADWAPSSMGIWNDAVQFVLDPMSIIGRDNKDNATNPTMKTGLSQWTAI